MSLLLWSLCWVSFSILVAMLIALETKRNDLHVCLVCGRVIDGPGICSRCAEEIESVPCVVFVWQVAPEYTVINPEDLRD
ncbi:hypothetical protein KGP36_02715 [Patescibacteria group bacterium]|nr:hypothetical protein [Patescibacteria group bacterium]